MIKERGLKEDKNLKSSNKSVHYSWAVYAIIISFVFFVFLIYPQQSAKVIEKSTDYIFTPKIENINDQVVTAFTPKINLGVLKEDDIIDLFKKNSVELKEGGWYNYEYNLDDGYFFDRLGAQFYGFDPFNSINYDYKDREFNLSHIRIFRLSSLEYENWISKTKEKIKIAQKIKCTEEDKCEGNLIYLRCLATGYPNMEYYNWYSSGYMFEARDKGLAINTFENFYC
ncbi:hypothetical protein J4403_00285 [Candidatus Woesearchaeota archaeon]|nr:hypothetical protein [Candidatus Woesearchaeota archaeon]